MTRLVLAALLMAAVVPVQAQTFLTLSERKKPLSDVVEKALVEFVDRCAEGKEKALTAFMANVLKSVDAAAKLSDADKTALREPTRKAVEEAVKMWKPQAVVAMRTYLTRTSDQGAIRHISQWRPDLTGPNEPVEDWSLPSTSSGWLAALRRVIGDERFKVWQEADAEKLKKSDEVIKNHVERWALENSGPLHEELQANIEEMKAKLPLDASQVENLKKAAESLVGQIADAEKKRAVAMLHTLTPAAREIFMSSGLRRPAFERPHGEAWDQRWESAATKALPADLAEKWRKISKEQRGKEVAVLADMIKPTETYMRQRMEMAVMAEAENISGSLNLGKERQDKLEKLGDEAVEESLKLGREQWLKQAASRSAIERKRMQTNTFFAMGEEQQALALPVWKDGVRKILSEAEYTRMTDENQRREQRALAALARACLAEMDSSLMLGDAQRVKLEPLLLTWMQPLMEQRRGQYWSYSPQQLFQAVARAQADTLASILDEVQLRRWEELMKDMSGSSRIPVSSGTMSEVPDMEATISAHLYKMFVVERKKRLDAMMPQVEEARRVLKLHDAVVMRLTTAAKGAVEQSLDYWRQNTERYVRQTVQNATPKNLLQALAGTARVSFGRDEHGPTDSDIWIDSLRDCLDDTQMGALEEAATARKSYRLAAMAAMSVSELDRRRRLTGEQYAKLEPLVRKILADYLPDIELHMSVSWFLQYYYALVPLAGVPEKEMQAILPASQWKLCKERDLPDAMQYWEGIKNNHNNRLKNGGNRNRVFFNGGLMIDE